MPLRIAFDLDGVLANMDRGLIQQAEILFPDSQPAGSSDRLNAEDADSPADRDPPSWIDRLSSRQQTRLWRHVEAIENFWESLEEIEPGVVARLAAVASQRRWEVIFLTKRPEGAGATSQVQTQRWLALKGFPMPSVYVVQNSRGHIASALDLDFVVDDRPENCLDVAVDSRSRAILVWRGPEAQLPPAVRRFGIGIVRSVNECIDVLERADADRQKPGMFDRVMQLLGFKESAGAP